MYVIEQALTSRFVFEFVVENRGTVVLERAPVVGASTVLGDVAIHAIPGLGAVLGKSTKREGAFSAGHDWEVVGWGGKVGDGVGKVQGLWGLNSWQGREVTRATVTLAREAVSAPRLDPSMRPRRSPEGNPLARLQLYAIPLFYHTAYRQTPLSTTRTENAGKRGN